MVFNIHKLKKVLAGSVLLVQSLFIYAGISVNESPSYDGSYLLTISPDVWSPFSTTGAGGTLYENSIQIETLSRSTSAIDVEIDNKPIGPYQYHFKACGQYSNPPQAGPYGGCDDYYVSVEVLEPPLQFPHALYEDYLENRINIIFTVDGFPIIFFDVNKYGVSPDDAGSYPCLDTPHRCSDEAISEGANTFQFYDSSKGGKIVVYFDLDGEAIGYGLNLDEDEYGDEQDEDIDGDGVDNDFDAFPRDASEWSDSDGDGVGDNSDAFPNNPGEWLDSDGDGVGNNTDAFPNDPNETEDLDGNGVGDNFDAIPTDLSHKFREPLVGEFNVGADGAAQYRIPLAVPPGINGIEPDFGIAYNSNKRIGKLRTGWSIMGLSDISRCPATKTKDGFVQNVKHNSGEKQRYCLDGQPLILIPGGTNGVYGAAGTHYVTQKRNDLLIIAKGQLGDGPAYFEVLKGDGSVMIYGDSGAEKPTLIQYCCDTTTGSNVIGEVSDEVLMWRLDTFTDNFGNQRHYGYHTTIHGDGIYTRIEKIIYQANLEGEEQDVVIDFKWDESRSYSDWTSIPDYGNTLQFFRTRDGDSFSAQTIDGTRIHEPHRVEQITMSVGAPYRQYFFEYQGSQSSKLSSVENLKSIKECAYGSCTDTIDFEWEEKHVGDPTSAACFKFNTQDYVGREPALSTSYITSEPFTEDFRWYIDNYRSQLVGDFDGDDLTDVAVAYTYGQGNESKISIHVAGNNGDGTFSSMGSQYIATIGQEIILNHRLAGDFNNDGYTDFVATNSSENGWKSYTILNNGDGTFANPVYQYLSSVSFLDQKTFRKTTGDFNGDGNLDLLAFGSGNNSNKDDSLYSRINGLVAYVALGNGDGTFGTVQGGSLATYSQLAAFIVRNKSLFTGDFNGDGITDIASALFANEPLATGGEYKGAEMLVAFGTESGNFQTPKIEYFSIPHLWAPNAVNYDKEVKLADVNGDGLPDIIATTLMHYGGILDANAYQTSQVELSDPDFRQRIIVSMINDGDGTFTRKIYEDAMATDSIAELEREQCKHTSNFGVVADFNGDGFSDISYGSNNFLLGQGNGRFLKQAGRYILGDDVERTGGGDFHLAAATISLYDPTYRTYAFDVNKDGNPDVVEVVVDQNGMRIGTNAYAENVSQQYLTKITDGYGRKIVIDYEAIDKGEVYTKGEDAVYPVVDIGTGLTVVKGVTIDDGTGGTYTQSYHYNNLRFNRDRRELLGFGSMSMTDSRDGREVTTVFSQEFPTIGQMLNQEIKLSNDTVVQSSGQSFDFDVNSNQIGSFEYEWYAVKKTSETSSTFDAAGDLVGTKTTSYTDFDMFGNPETITTTQSDGYSAVSTLVLSNNTDAENYYVGRVDSSTVVKTSPDFQSTITQKKSFTYYDNGAIHFEIVEPDDVNLYDSLEYVYNAYGQTTNVIRRGSEEADLPVLPRTESNQFNLVASTSIATQYTVNKLEIEIINTNAEGHETKTFVDAWNGLVLRTEDANALQTIYNRNVHGELEQQISPDGILTTYTRDVCNVHCPENAVFRVFTRTAGQPFVETYFDLYSRPVRTRTLGLNGETIYQDITYDQYGRKLSETQPYVYDDQEVLVNSYAYNSLGQLESATTPEVGTTTFAYEARSGFGIEITKTESRVTPEGTSSLVTIERRNLSDQPVEVVNAANKSTKYKYDANLNLKQTEDPSSNLVTMSFDILGRPIGIIDPDLGVNSYAVDAFGQRRSFTDAKEQSITYTYDRLGRLTKRIKPEGEDEWVFDIGNKAIGRLSSEASADGAVKDFLYDNYGRLESETLELNEESFSLAYGYDSNGRLDSVEYPTGFKVFYSYNEFSHLQSVYSGDLTYWYVLDQNAKGETLSELFGNGLIASTGYHANTGRIEATAISSGMTSLQSFSYVFDSIGNLYSRTDGMRGNTESFVYDSLNRLNNVYKNGSLSKSYTYDAIGNIKSKSDFGSNYVYGENGAGPHAVTSITTLNDTTISFSYDDNGNLESGNGKSVSWTSFDKPRSISANSETISFEYDANQTRVLKETSATTTLYINPRWGLGVSYEREITGSQAVHKHYINGSSHPVAVYKTVGGVSGGTVSYLHKDHLGSITAISDEAGNLIEEFSFDPFGKRRNADWTDSSTAISSNVTDHGFTSHEQLDEMGLIHMNARIYDPSIGRFLSADTFIPSVLNSEAFNRYSYVYNNPLSLTDPSGNSPLEDLWQWISRKFGASFNRAFAGAARAAASNDAGISHESGTGDLSPSTAGGGVKTAGPTVIEETLTIGYRSYSSDTILMDMARDSYLDQINMHLEYINVLEGVLSSSRWTAPSAYQMSILREIGGQRSIIKNLEYELLVKTDQLGLVESTPVLNALGVSGAIRSGSRAYASSKLAEARAARDALASKLGTLPADKRPATVTAGYNTKTGQVAARACGGGKCAEDHVVVALGGDKNLVKFTEAARPRPTNPPYKEVPVCDRCEFNYGREAFPPGTKFKSDQGGKK